MKASILLLATALLTACDRPVAHSPSEEKATSHSAEAAKSDAVTFKEGHGLSFHPKISQSLGIKVAEAAEAAVAAEFSVQLHVTGNASGIQQIASSSGTASKVEASGWLPEAQAALLKPGQPVDLRVNQAGVELVEKGVVQRVQKAQFAALGEYEVVVESDAPFADGTRLGAIFRVPPGDPVTAVPRSALLKTVEGWFVYTLNESFYLRTPVKVGAMNSEVAEITDGLYSGDQIVVSPVNSLWMAELQILRGGKSCTCGH